MTKKQFVASIIVTIVLVLFLIPWDVYGLAPHANGRYQIYQSYMDSTGHVFWIGLHITLIIGLIYYSPSQNDSTRFFTEKRFINLCLFILTVSPLLASIAYNILIYAWQDQESVIHWIFVILLSIFLFPTIQYYLILSVINKNVYILCLIVISIFNWITASYIDPVMDGAYDHGVPFYIILPVSLLFTFCIITLFFIFADTKDEFPFQQKFHKVSLILCISIYVVTLGLGLYAAWTNIYHFVRSITGIFYCIFCSYLVLVMNLFIIVQVLELHKDIEKEEEQIYERLSTRSVSASLINIFDVKTFYDKEHGVFV